MKKWLIIYDIRDKRRLPKVAKVLSEYGVRVQKSVFELEGNDKSIKRIRYRVKKIIKEDEDFIVYFNICEPDWQKRVKYGPAVIEEAEEKDFYIL
jgi:CRISPR-associated protein Cas2